MHDKNNATGHSPPPRQLRGRREQAGDSLEAAAHKIGAIIGRRINKSTVHRLENGTISAEPFLAAYDQIYPVRRVVPAIGYHALVETIRRGARRWIERPTSEGVGDGNGAHNSNENDGRWLKCAEAFKSLIADSPRDPISMVLSSGNPAVGGSDQSSRNLLERALLNSLPIGPNETGSAYQHEIIHFQRIASNAGFEKATWSALLTGLEWSIVLAQRHDFRSSDEPDAVAAGRDLTRHYGYRFMTIEADERPITFPSEVLQAGQRAIFCVPARSDSVCDIPLSCSDAGELTAALGNLRSTAAPTILVYPPMSRAMSAFIDAFRRDIDERFVVDRPFFSSFPRPEHHRRPGTAWWKRLAEKWRPSHGVAESLTIEAEIRRHAENEADVFRRWQLAMKEKGGRYAQLVCKTTIEAWASTGARTDRGEAPQDLKVDANAATESLEYVDRIISLIKETNGAFQLALSDDKPDGDAVGVAVQGGHHIGWEVSCGAGYVQTMSGYVRNSMMARDVASEIEAKISKLPEKSRLARPVIEYLETKIRPPLVERVKRSRKASSV